MCEPNQLHQIFSEIFAAADLIRDDQELALAKLSLCEELLHLCGFSADLLSHFNEVVDPLEVEFQPETYYDNQEDHEDHTDSQELDSAEDDEEGPYIQ